VWSWWKEGSVHHAPWPSSADVLAAIGGDDTRAAEALEEGCRVLGEVRKRKSEEKKPLRTPVVKAVIKAPRHNLDLLDLVWRDVSASGAFLCQPERVESPTFESLYELGEPDARS
jgi:valyl-tRNA synthetase